MLPKGAVPDDSVIQGMHDEMLPLIDRHTVAIVAYYQGAMHQHGTGTLVRFADYRFLVTASHVVKQFLEGKEIYRDIYLLVENGHEADLVPLHGEYFVTKTARDKSSQKYASDGDDLDVALWNLGEKTYSKLSNKAFLNRSHISITAELTTGLYFLVGFPCSWATCDLVNRSFFFKAFRYIAEPLLVTETLPEYNPRLHMALRLHMSGVESFQLQGISGCSIWKLSDLPVNATWNANQARIVAVQTGVFSRSAAIKGTKWQHVVTLLSQFAPELIPSLRLWLPGPE